MRAPFQILVIPFRHTAAGLEFAVLKRSDADCWQFVAGGGDDGETPIQAAGRETLEEVGIKGQVIRLDSIASVPKDCFAAAKAWGDQVFVIPEHCFAVDAEDSTITLSGEHTDLRWLSYEQAFTLLKWDSNRTALWELNERLKRTPNQISHRTVDPSRVNVR
ncbi:MAG: NUDIX pyrophosphatase [bacterium]